MAYVPSGGIPIEVKGGINGRIIENGPKNFTVSALLYVYGTSDKSVEDAKKMLEEYIESQATAGKG